MGILVIIPIAAAIALLERKRIEDFFFGAIAIIIFGILISGYVFHNTLLGVYIGLVLGIISLTYCIYIFYKDKVKVKEYIFTPGFTVMIIFSILSGLLLINKTSLGGDNDTYWAHAPQILNMYKNSNIGGTGEVSKNYTLWYTMPIYTSWCYFCNKLWGIYSDGINLWARQIFIMAAFMPFFSFIQKKEWKKIILICIVITLFPGMIDNNYDFMPDIPVAALAIYGTLMTIKLYQQKETYNDRAYLIFACLCTMYTYCIKRMGGYYIFGILGIATVYTIDRIIENKNQKKIKVIIAPFVMLVISTITSMFYFKYRNKMLEDDKLLTILPIVCFFIFIIVGIICKIMQYLINKRKNLLFMGLIISSCLIISTFIVKIADKYGKHHEEKSVKILWRFLSMWFTSTERFGKMWKLSDFQFVLMLFIAMIIIRKKIIKNKVKYVYTISDFDNTITVIFSGYVVYMFLYCFIYCFRQGHYTADNQFVCNVRYLGPAVMIVTAMVLYIILNIKDIYCNKILAGLAVFLLLLLPHNPFMILSIDDKIGWDTYNTLYRESGIELTEYDNVCVVGDDNLIYYVFPARWRQFNEVNTCEMDQAEWSYKIKVLGCNYLLIGNYEKYSFYEKYQDMFLGGKEAISKFSLYKVRIEEDRVYFEKIGSLDKWEE